MQHQLLFFLSRGDTAAKLCIKSLQKPHKVLKRESLICLLLPMHLIIPQCDLIVLLSYLYTASFDFPSRLECTELDCDVFFAVRHEHPRTRWKKPVSSFVFFMANTLFIEKYIRRNSKTPPNDQQNLNSYLTELIYACTHLSQNGLRLNLIAEPHTLRKFGNPSIREMLVITWPYVRPSHCPHNRHTNVK